MSAAAWWEAQVTTAYAQAVAAGVKNPAIVLLVHSRSDVRAKGLPVFCWCGVISTPESILSNVLDERCRSVRDGGLGANRIQLHP